MGIFNFGAMETMKRQQATMHPRLSNMPGSSSFRKTTILLLAAGLFLPFGSTTALAQALDTSILPKAVHGQVAISRNVNIAPGNIKVSLNLRDAALADVLNMLAEQGKF